jgi:holin-like protein
MIGAIAALLAFQLVGEVIVTALAIPIPGPVVGMLLLFAMLLVRGSAPASLSDTARGILQHLSLLFVPAGAGVLAHFSLIRSQFWGIAITLVGSTMITISVTAWVMHFFLRRVGQGAGGQV